MSKFHLTNLYHLPAVLFRIKRSLDRQRNFLQGEFGDLYQQVRENNDGSVLEDDFYKMTRYYGHAVPAILGEAVSLMRGNSLSKKERKLSTSQGIITGIYDDFMDKNRLSAEEVKDITQNPRAFPCKRLIDQLFVENWGYVIEEVKHPDFLWEMVARVAEAQNATKEQTELQLSYVQAREITYTKGAYSVLFYRSVYDNALKESEQEAFYNLGALLQLGNDIFDVYFDKQEGIHTMLTQADGLKNVVHDFQSLKAEMIQSFFKLPYSTKQIRSALHFLMPVINRCEVCLHHLIHLEEKNGHFQVEKFTRKQVICDMERPINFVRTARRYLATKI
jgi:hypothetical protein